MRRKISLVFILIGIVFLSLPFLSKKVMQHKVRQEQDILNEVTAKEIEENEKKQAEYDYSSIKDIGVASIVTETNKLEHKAMVGQISIESLNMNLPILKGTTNSNLMVGATTMVEGQKMGKGNYPLAGHYTKDKGMFFGGLIDIELGTLVRISDKKTIYEYKVYDTVIVSDADMYMLEDQRWEARGKPIISLMTCYYTSRNGKRFFALGELIDEYPYDGNNIEKQDKNL